MNVVKFIPPLTLTDQDCRWIVEAVRDVVADAHRVPGAAWEFGKTLANQALRMKTARDS
jgi:ornithine--oxo-acid transaminase